jgi:hypothetical protein
MFIYRGTFQERKSISYLLFQFKKAYLFLSPLIYKTRKKLLSPFITYQNFTSILFQKEKVTFENKTLNVLESLCASYDWKKKWMIRLTQDYLFYDKKTVRKNILVSYLVLAIWLNTKCSS